MLCVRATCVVDARAPTRSLRKKGGTTLDIRDMAASYSSIVRYSCSTRMRTPINLAFGSWPLREVQQFVLVRTLHLALCLFEGSNNDDTTVQYASDNLTPIELLHVHRMWEGERVANESFS